MMNSDWTWIILAVVLVAAVLVAAVASRRRARVRSAELRRRFGPEYDKTVEEYGSTARAERELAARTRRVDRIHFRDLGAGDRARFEATWTGLQARFVDDPAGAVAGANELIKEVMRARGYPADGFEQRVRDLSVEHPAVVEHYRAARTLSEARTDDPKSTEELRQAVVHYRVIFADLLQEGAEPTVHEEREPLPPREDPRPHVGG